MAKPVKQMVDPRIHRFADVAERFCAFLDNRKTRPGIAFIRKTHPLLVELYAAALILPDVAVTSSRTLATVPGFTGWKRLRMRIAEKTRRYDLYWEMFDPYDSNEHKPVCGSLADDLADIYQDLMTGFMSYRRGTSKAIAEATWHWRFSFYSHWGEHATSAIRAMYWAQRNR